jgi:quercetin dioxygenase-like cupin family protein
MSYASKTFIFGKDVTPVEMLPGIVRKTLSYSDSMLVCEVRLAKGAVLPSHHHVHEQSSNIISGSVRYTVGEEEHIVGAGDSVMLGSDMPHAVEALEDTLVIDIFSPVRPEYI